MVKIVLHRVLDKLPVDGEKEKEQLLPLTDHLTLEKAVGLADLSGYYPLSGKFSWNCQYLPYLISEGVVKWNVPYSEAKVSDFIATHAIPDNTIVAQDGYPQAGGPGFLDWMEIWEQIYPILESFATIAGVASALTATGKWLVSLRKHPETPALSYFDLIFSRPAWNHFELSRLLQVDPQDGKQILLSLGYQYDRKTLLYVQQPKSLELKEKLSNVQVHDL